ncbi:MAG: GIY-YIG nuclease family protein, partial [Bacteroidetes bacterium]|nr:GIY-YIG nuclease family protein [Bacteroidota bacterium]
MLNSGHLPWCPKAFMPYFVYILYSKSADRYYVGETDNIDKRLQ